MEGSGWDIPTDRHFGTSHGPPAHCPSTYFTSLPHTSRLHRCRDAAACPSPAEFRPSDLQFSAYTASRMNTWTEKGRANVKLMLAKMSIPPEQSNANFSEHRERGWGVGDQWQVK